MPTHPSKSSCNRFDGGVRRLLAAAVGELDRAEHSLRKCRARTELACEATLFSLWMPRLSKPKSFPAAVFVDEFDTGSLQSGSDCLGSRNGNRSPFSFEVDDRREVLGEPRAQAAIA